MATYIDKQTRQFLSDTGYWREFQIERDRLQEDNPIYDDVIQDAALAKYIRLGNERAKAENMNKYLPPPPFPPETDSLGFDIPPEIRDAPAWAPRDESEIPEDELEDTVEEYTPVQAEATPAADRVSEDAKITLNVSVASDSGDGAKPARVVAPSSGFDYSRVREKKAGAVESIEWVAKWIAEKKLTQDIIDTAPCMEAIGMHQSYSSDYKRKEEFWDKVYVKLIPPKSQLDDAPKLEVDGKKIMFIIDSIMNTLKNKAMA